MNISWFSPLDAKRTEIGRYSQALLPHLHDTFSLGVVTDTVETYQEFDSKNHAIGMGPVNIYNIGNSFMHCGIVHHAMQHPGLVILHDVSLLELGLAYAREHADFDLQEMVINEYGVQAGKDFASLYCGDSYEWCGESQQQYDEFVTSFPLFETFTGNALGIVVHSDYALDKVKKKFKGPVFKLDLPYDAPLVDTELRQLVPPLQIIFCGHAGPNRRLKQFIDAWSKVSQPEYFRLSLYGNVDKAEELIGQAEVLNLSHLVNVVGFVDDDTLDQAIGNSHLALNLRNPTVGEASASQLRYWSRAISSIVSDVGWYAELPENTVLKVAPEREENELILALENLISGKTNATELGLAGNRYLHSQHNVQRYTEQLAEYLALILENRFLDSIFDNRLIEIAGSMCREAEDTFLFESTLTRLAEMVTDLEKVQTS